jgi:hypothetical protein
MILATMKRMDNIKNNNLPSFAFNYFPLSFELCQYHDTFDMTAPLIECTEGEQLSVIQFLWSEGVKTGEIY